MNAGYGRKALQLLQRELQRPVHHAVNQKAILARIDVRNMLISARPQFPPGTFALIDWENGRMEFSVGTVGTIAAEMPAYRRYVRSEPDVCVPAADDARSCRGQGSIPTLTGTLKKKTGLGHHTGSRT